MDMTDVSFKLSHAEAILRTIDHGFFGAREWDVENRKNCTIEDRAVAFACLRDVVENYNASLIVAAVMIGEALQVVDQC